MKVLSVFLTTLVPAAIAFADAPVPSDPFYSDADGYTGTRTLATLVSSSSTGTNPDYGYMKPYSWGGVTLTDDYDCLVTSNKTIYVMSAERVFPGHSLQIGTADGYTDKTCKGVFFDYCHPEANPFEITGDLIFVNGELKFRYVDSTVIKAGKVSLDTDVSDLAGFTIRNPKYPDTPITLEMLMSHLSSLSDHQGYYTLDGVNPKTNKDYALAYRDFAPGEQYRYTNLNFSLSGTILERLSGERFDQYVVHHILEPLGLYGGYCVDSLDTSRFAQLYSWNDKKGAFVKQPDAYARKNEIISIRAQQQLPLRL